MPAPPPTPAPQPPPTAAPAGVAVRLRAVRRVFDNGTVAVEGVSLDVAAGEFVALLGPSGCGKSTLLRLIAGLDAPQAGEVAVAGVPSVPGRRVIHDEIAFVFQDAHLLPWRRVLRNVELPLELRHVERRARRRAALAALEQVGLSEALARYPAHLSGGMRMRVSLARALVTQPRILLLDEPFAALDELTRLHLDEQLYQLWLRRRITVLFVTHSISEATFLAQRAVVFSRRPARVVLDRPIDLPPPRPPAIRTEPRFNLIARELYAALERQEAPT